MAKNLLVIVSDQHHAGTMGWAGHPVAITPNLDRLAAEGTAFERCWCTSPLCVPARIGLLSGRYACHTGAYSLGATFRDDTPTYAHVAEASGREAVLAGRMHLTWADRLHGHRRRLTPEPYADIRNNRERWQQPLRENDYSSVIEGAGPGHSRPWNTDREAITQAQDWLRRQQDPFALTLCLYQPHHPYVAPPRWWSRYEGLDLPLPAPIPPMDEIHPADQDLYRFRGFHKRHPSADGVRRAVCGYLGSVSSLDEMIGWVLNTLADTDQLDDTLIVYTSDHGEQLGANGTWEKSALWEASVRVPMIMRGPGVVAGKRINAPVSHVDLLPTLAEATGESLDPDLPLDGRSLWGLATGTETATGFWQTRGVLSEYADYGVRTPMAALTIDRHKLIRADGYADRLFDLEADPDERDDLALREPELVQALGSELDRRWQADQVRRQVLADQAGFALIERAHQQAGFLDGNWPPPSAHNLGVDDGT